MLIYFKFAAFRIPRVNRKSEHGEIDPSFGRVSDAKPQNFFKKRKSQQPKHGVRASEEYWKALHKYGLEGKFESIHVQ